MNCIVAQSGGPTAAINASLAGVVAAARDFGIYDKIYGAIHGIQGVLKKHFLDLSGKDDTFMASMEVGKGRTFAFASDCAMHWGSKAFLAWDGYQKVMPNIFKWLAKEI